MEHASLEHRSGRALGWHFQSMWCVIPETSVHIFPWRFTDRSRLAYTSGFYMGFFLSHLMASFSYNRCILPSAQISQALVLCLTCVQSVLIVASHYRPSARQQLVRSCRLPRLFLPMSKKCKGHCICLFIPVPLIFALELHPKYVQ